MAVKQRMLGSGYAPQQADQIAGPGPQGLTATGSGTTDGLIIGAHLNTFTTVASGTGALLAGTPTGGIAPFSPGDEVTVTNLGANTLTVYPPLSPASTIDNTTSATIAANKSIKLLMVSTTQWVSFKST